MQKLQDDLLALLGPNGLLIGDAISDHYATDRSLAGHIRPRLVMRPQSTEEVSACLKICHEAGQPIVPQGGLSGLAGGAILTGNEISLSLERLSGIEEVDDFSLTLKAKAGTPLQMAQAAADAKGLQLAFDLGARGSCQLGGNIATNAGGYRVIRYGMTRAHVLGLEVVLPDGTILSDMRKFLKNNTGFDWKQLFIGSEGTLGIITRVLLRLSPMPAATQTALCACSHYDQVLELLKLTRAQLNLTGFEVMWKRFHQFSAAAAGLQFFDQKPEFILIIEQQGMAPSQDQANFEAVLAQALEQGLVSDCLIAQSGKEAQSFWTMRETLVLDRLPNLINFDVSLDIPRIGEFAEICMSAIEARWPGCHHSYFGHIGDGNLHICVSAGEDIHAVEDLVYEKLRDFGGSISAEHGIGTLKKPYLGFSRSAEELALMGKMKSALDPQGLMNPGKVF